MPQNEAELLRPQRGGRLRPWVVLHTTGRLGFGKGPGNWDGVGSYHPGLYKLIWELGQGVNSVLIQGEKLSH